MSHADRGAHRPSPDTAALPTPLYPLFLKLEGQRVLLVGAGYLAMQKLDPLLAAGAHIHVVAPEVRDVFRTRASARYAQDVGRVTIETRAYDPADIAGARLVIAATDKPAVNHAVCAAARAAGVLVNVVDVIDACDFYTGGIVRRGPLTLVIGTNGAAPSLARHTRLWLEDTLPTALGDVAAWLGQTRPAALRAHPDFKSRARVLGGAVKAAATAIHAGTDSRTVLQALHNAVFARDANAERGA